MATNRIESPAPAPEAAAEASAAAPAPASGGGFKSWLSLIVNVVVMAALAFAMTEFLIVPKVLKGLGITASAATPKKDPAKKPDANAKKETVSLNKLLVNVAGTMGGRYLLVSLSVEATDPDLKTKMQEADPKIRDMAQGILRLKSLADLEKPTAQNLIRSELIAGFNSVLGGSIVQEIYFTEFAIQ